MQHEIICSNHNFEFKNAKILINFWQSTTVMELETFVHITVMKPMHKHTACTAPSLVVCHGQAGAATKLYRQGNTKATWDHNCSTASARCHEKAPPHEAGLLKEEPMKTNFMT